MKTKTRSLLAVHQMRDIKLPYEVMHFSYEPTMQYRDNRGNDLPVPIEVRQTHVHVTIYDDCEKYIFRGEGLSQQMHSGYAFITNENIPLDLAIKIAKLDALRSLSDKCHGYDSIYVCLPRNLPAFLRKIEPFVQRDNGNKEYVASGLVTIIETRTD